MDMKQMMRQAQKMQKELNKAQEEIATMSFEATAGGGMVTAVASGDMAITSLTIDPDAVDPEDVEMLQDPQTLHDRFAVTALLRTYTNSAGFLSFEKMVLMPFTAKMTANTISSAAIANCNTLASVNAPAAIAETLPHNVMTNEVSVTMSMNTMGM